MVLGKKLVKVAKKYPKLDIKYTHQDGKGKGGCG